MEEKKDKPSAELLERTQVEQTALATSLGLSDEDKRIIEDTGSIASIKNTRLRSQLGAEGLNTLASMAHKGAHSKSNPLGYPSLQMGDHTGAYLKKSAEAVKKAKEIRDKSLTYQKALTLSDRQQQLNKRGI